RTSPAPPGSGGETNRSSPYTGAQPISKAREPRAPVGANRRWVGSPPPALQYGLPPDCGAQLRVGGQNRRAPARSSRYSAACTDLRTTQTGSRGSRAANSAGQSQLLALFGGGSLANQECWA